MGIRLPCYENSGDYVVETFLFLHNYLIWVFHPPAPHCDKCGVKVVVTINN